MYRGASPRQLAAAARRAPARLGQLSLSELALLVQTPFALPVMALALRRYGLRRVQSFLGRRRPPGPRNDDAIVRGAEARRLAWIVNVTAAYGPWQANCLERSLVLWWFLHRRGLEGELRIGVRRDERTRALDFHAWIEHDGVVVNDRADIRQRYATFERAVAPAGARFG